MFSPKKGGNVCKTFGPCHQVEVHAVFQQHGIGLAVGHVEEGAQGAGEGVDQAQPRLIHGHAGQHAAHGHVPPGLQILPVGTHPPERPPISRMASWAMASVMGLAPLPT